MINITIISYVAVSSLKILVIDDMGSDLFLMVKMEKLGHPESHRVDTVTYWTGRANVQHASPPPSLDLRSLKCVEKLRHVFHLVGNSPQTAELNTALDSPSYTPGHGPIFHLNEPG